jgi:histidinol-phosphate/aromatic aminotransferase/cobyric acid decarboxylase-like protein
VFLAPGAEQRLAISSYVGVGPLADTDDELNLAWTSDERDCLDIDLTALVRAELAAEIDDGLPYVYSYPVADPYGEAALGPAVAAYFGLPSPPVGLTCGAGVGPVLNGLARLAKGRQVGIIGHVYPDFPFWVGTVSGRCVPWRLHDPHGGVLFLERPALAGEQVDLVALREICADAAGGTVVVDESNANYCPPSFSAVHLVADTPNLVVVRGLSKAYGLGGLRLSYCVVGADALDSVRTSVAPLLASTLSLRIGARVLGAGDITSGLRALIAAARREAGALLTAFGTPPTRTAPEPFPYLLFDSADTAEFDRLAAAGVRGKRHLYWAGEAGHLYRLSVPLLPARMAELAARLGH